MTNTTIVPAKPVSDMTPVEQGEAFCAVRVRMLPDSANDIAEIVRFNLVAGTPFCGMCFDWHRSDETCSMTDADMWSDR
jgi:hypothetical protein